MNNKAALTLAILIIAVFAADHFYFEANLPVFLGRKLVDLMDWLAIWR